MIRCVDGKDEDRRIWREREMKEMGVESGERRREKWGY
jgi:hypothetical protein